MLTMMLRCADRTTFHMGPSPLFRCVRGELRGASAEENSFAMLERTGWVAFFRRIILIRCNGPLHLRFKDDDERQVHTLGPRASFTLRDHHAFVGHERVAKFSFESRLWHIAGGDQVSPIMQIEPVGAVG